MHLEDRTSMRGIARQQHITKKYVNDAIHSVTQKSKDPLFIKERFHPKWHGILSVDGKYIKTYDRFEHKTHHYCWIVGIDYPTKDLPYYILHDEKGKIDMVIFFQKLKELNYPLKVLISDDNHAIYDAAKHVYGNTFQFQLCTFHYMRKIETMIQTNDFLVERIRRIIHIRDKELLYKNIEWLFTHKHLFKNSPHKEIFTDFQNHLEHLITAIYYPTFIPRTNIEIENLFRQVNIRLKTMGRFHNYTYAQNYLNTWALMRRFTPFTDCRKPHKYRNGKAPLTLAGCDITNIDYLSL